MNNFIRTENLCYSYDDEDHKGVEVLKNVNITIERGEYVCVLGHNGSGKSTFAKLLNMILIPTSGKVYIDGLDVNDESFSEDDVFSIRQKIGMVFQNPDNQLVATIVEEDVAFGPENLGIKPELMRKKVDHALESVGMLEYAKYAPHRLSGGQKQRIAIAGIIAMNPQCIIFDESTAMLDPSGRADVVSIMEKLNAEGITVLNITHHMDEAIRADRVIIINDGQVCIDGTPSEVFSNMDMLKQFGLEAPQGTELLYELNTYGESFTLPCLDDEECVKKIMDHYRSL